MALTGQNVMDSLIVQVAELEQLPVELLCRSVILNIATRKCWGQTQLDHQKRLDIDGARRAGKPGT